MCTIGLLIMAKTMREPGEEIGEGEHPRLSVKLLLIAESGVAIG